MFQNFNQGNSSGIDPDDALESRKIPLQTIIPDGIITAGDAKNVRFDFSKKNGYSPKQVDKYVFEVVSQSLEFYGRKLESRDRDVHRLGKDLNDAEVDFQRIKRQLEVAESNSIIVDSIARAKTDPEFEALTDEIAALRTKLHAYESGSAVQSEATTTGASPEQLAEFNATIEEYQSALAAHEQNVSYYEGQIETLTAERNTYHTQATEYYEQVTNLQKKLDSFAEDTSSALYNASQELSNDLLAIQQAKMEVDENYANLYTQFTELRATIPESGIIPADEHVKLQISYDQVSSQLADSTEKLSELEEEVTSLKKGTLAGSGAITENDYNNLHAQAEAIQKEAQALEAKYAVLISSKQGQDQLVNELEQKIALLTEQASSVGDVILPDLENYVSKEDYEALHAQAAQAINLYNDLTGEYNVLYEQYTELIAQLTAAGYMTADDSSETQDSPQQAVEDNSHTQYASDDETLSQVTYSESQATNEEAVSYQTPAEPEETAKINFDNPNGKYQNKNLPEGIRLEDLE